MEARVVGIYHVLQIMHKHTHEQLLCRTRCRACARQWERQDGFSFFKKSCAVSRANFFHFWVSVYGDSFGNSSL